MIDPLVPSVISIGLGLMFLLASVHKFTGFAAFRAVLADYRVMPAALVPIAAAVLPFLEIALGAGWLFRADVPALAPATGGLLVLYSSAIAVNLLRGRVHISCGCGFGKATGGNETLSWGLVGRNACLVVAAAATMLPTAPRVLGLFDYLTLAAALLAVILLFSAANQLLRNSAAINTWRKPTKRHD